MCGAFSSFCSLPSPPFTVYQCDGCLSYLGRGGSWLGCQVWPAISAVSILELVANSDSSRMSRAPNLHSLRATKLFTLNKENNHVMTTSRCLMSEGKKHNNIEPILEGKWSCETRHRDNDFLKPVTFVPITNGKGTSSGKSLNLLNSLTWKWNQQTHFSDSHLWDWNL